MVVEMTVVEAAMMFRLVGSVAQAADVVCVDYVAGK